MQGNKWKCKQVKVPVCGNRRGLLALLNEEGFSKLIAGDERLRGAVPREKVLDFAVLVNALGRAKHRTRNHLQRVGIGDSITLESFRFLTVEHREDHSARA